MLEKPPSLLKPNSEPLLFKGRLEGKEIQVMLVPLDCHCHLFQEAPMTTPILSRLKFVNLCCLAVFCPQREQKHGGKEPELESENLCSLLFLFTECPKGSHMVSPSLYILIFKMELL